MFANQSIYHCFDSLKADILNLTRRYTKHKKGPMLFGFVGWQDSVSKKILSCFCRDNRTKLPLMQLKHEQRREFWPPLTPGTKVSYPYPPTEPKARTGQELEWQNSFRRKGSDVQKDPVVKAPTISYHKQPSSKALPPMLHMPACSPQYLKFCPELDQEDRFELCFLSPVNLAIKLSLFSKADGIVLSSMYIRNEPLLSNTEGFSPKSHFRRIILHYVLIHLRMVSVADIRDRRMNKATVLSWVNWGIQTWSNTDVQWQINRKFRV